MISWILQCDIIVNYTSLVVDYNVLSMLPFMIRCRLVGHQVYIACYFVNDNGFLRY